MAVPILVLLLIAVVDGGRMFYTYLQVIEAARAGAQYGAQGFATDNDKTGMQNHAIAAAPNVSGLTAVATSFCCCPSSDGKSCANFGNSSATTFTESCGVDPINVQKCPDWRRYDQVTATATFRTILTFGVLPSTLTFSSSSSIRSR
jgi:Flp pilus assembly protein TadG